MKRFIILLLILCLCAGTLGCTGETAVTDTDTTNTVTDTDVTATETEKNDTETEQITETESETVTETETAALPVLDEVYKVYDPLIASYEYTESLTLHNSGTYELECGYTDNSSGIPVHIKSNERGDYILDDGGVDLELDAESISIEFTFDNTSDKEQYLLSVKTLYQWGGLDGEAYELLKKAANGGYTGQVSDIGAVIPNVSGSGISKAVIDKDTAYLLLPGIAPSDNEYYIAETGYMLILNGDGTCRMRYEGIAENADFGEYVMTDIYDGTYKRTGDQITAVMTENTTRHRFINPDDETSYREYYESQYSGGFLGKIYYDYYMALISEGGYTDDDMSDNYIISVEEHTHTAVIIESPESET